jgi:hypothetical protein
MSEIAGYQKLPPRLPRAINRNAEIMMLRLWKGGLDTYAIAIQLQIPEHQVYITLPRLREEAKRSAEWNFDEIVSPECA